MAFAVRCARWTRKEQVAAARVEVDRVRDRRSPDGDGTLPKLTAVLDSERIGTSIAARDVEHAGARGEGMSLACVPLVRIEAVLEFAIPRRVSTITAAEEGGLPFDGLKQCIEGVDIDYIVDRQLALAEGDGSTSLLHKGGSVGHGLHGAKDESDGQHREENEG